MLIFHIDKNFNLDYPLKNNTDVVGNNVKIINCSCNGKNKSLSPSATQYSPLSNDGQEKPSSAM